MSKSIGLVSFRCSYDEKVIYLVTRACHSHLPSSAFGYSNFYVYYSFCIAVRADPFFGRTIIFYWTSFGFFLQVYLFLCIFWITL